MKKLIVLLIFTFAVLMAQDVSKDIIGFRDFAWDTPYTEISEGMVKSSGINPGYKGYEIPGDDMEFAGLEAQTILYLFKQNKFNCISFVYKNDQLDTLINNLTKLYGEPKATLTPFINNYEWHFPSSVMVLSHFPMNESDKSVALGIRKPK